MLEAISALKGYAIEASDGRIGTVSDFLFGDQTWRVQWLVVDTGTWLTERKVLVHPSSIKLAEYERQAFAVKLTKDQVLKSPNLLKEEPVSRQIQRQLHHYYGSDPLWSGARNDVSIGVMAAPYLAAPSFGFYAPTDIADVSAVRPDGDPHLRSIAEVTGYHIAATDGEIGHVENFLLDSTAWAIDYLIVDTRNWWPGKRVLMSSHAVKDFNWAERQISVNVTRQRVKTSPPWDPLVLMNQAEMKLLHAHYGWPALGT